MYAQEMNQSFFLLMWEVEGSCTPVITYPFQPFPYILQSQISIASFLFTLFFPEEVLWDQP